ncbi:hypothetical protein GII33_02830 [Gordonia pseudamarae]|uniref:EXPERA domain-containing protein n=1 Tax=Gordonia pseudamarae TaxID=2831662 RepID=A0ABX6IQH1_9ACTN|nr:MULTISPECIES: hypothetical protein [Gordonia]MBD0022367.1 hypothetical protein [Gordonia sp. (in: high G+C Gram-positive bacteria)]QHN28423.1 hypothetical protein GII33_02830 [Gordonia pseudamarae]QHN37288.1 hypothetical protein GII31_02825 [Gordonia pseudamarae]
MTSPTSGGLSYDQHEEDSKIAQRQADKWLITGTGFMGTLVFGFIGLPIFLRGLYLQRKAMRDGLSVRPMMVTLIGYLVILDAFINSLGWVLDVLANHSILNRVFFTAWGNFADNGYFWEYNSLFIGGSSAPGEKGWEIACIFVVFPMRIAAAIAFLQMKRWGHQWLIVTCWMGVVIWVGYIVNMTMYADIRFEGTILPVVGWWAFDIFYITPFLAIPYLHTVNREIFAD